MEQIADLYAMENTVEATASTSRNTGSRNANGGIFVQLQQALARIGVLEQDLAAERAARQNDLVRNGLAGAGQHQPRGSDAIIGIIAATP